MREGKALTVWTTSFTTLTITTTSYLSDNTVTASALCTVPGMYEHCYGRKWYYLNVLNYVGIVSKKVA